MLYDMLDSVVSMLKSQFVTSAVKGADILSVLFYPYRKRNMMLYYMGCVFYMMEIKSPTFMRLVLSAENIHCLAYSFSNPYSSMLS